MKEYSKPAKRTAEMFFTEPRAVASGCNTQVESLTRSLPLPVLYLSPASRALDDLLTLYPSLKCWAIVGRPFCGLY